MRPAAENDAQGFVDGLNAAVEERARQLAEQADTANESDGYTPRHDGTQERVGPDYEPRPWKWATQTLPAIGEQIAGRLIAPVIGTYRITSTHRFPPHVQIHTPLPDTSRPAPAGAGPSPDFFDFWIAPS